MIRSARHLQQGDVLTCDVLVIGAGAAGITLALELEGAGRRVVLLEAGGKRGPERSLSLYRGTVSDEGLHLPPHRDRDRRLGGTTSLWGGRCIPYDSIDFARRDYVADSGWPFAVEELQEDYRRAHRLCECGAYDYAVSTALPTGTQSMVPGLEGAEVDANTIERWSPPTRFGKRYRSTLEQSSSVEVLLNGVAQRLVLDGPATRVAEVEACTVEGRAFKIRPRICVLAGGGLEVTRLLLASWRAAQLREPDWLGKGYMCHISGVLARARFLGDRPIVFGYERDHDGVYCRRKLTIPEAVQRREGLLNTNILLDRPLLGDPDHGSAMLSLGFLAKWAVGGQRSRSTRELDMPLVARHVRNLIAGSPELYRVLPGWLRGRFVQGRRLPSLLVGPRDRCFYLYYQAEQAPERASRVSLGPDRDALGMPRLHADFRVSEQDVDSVVRTHEHVDATFRHHQVGSLEYLSPDPRELVRQHCAVLGHHLGTTRMSATPRDGVVDPDARYWGVSNLYIASGSVLPTSSQANPTLTVVALASRLARHLRARMSAAGVDVAATTGSERNTVAPHPEPDEVSQ